MVEDLLPLRNDLVHSHLRVALLDQQAVACFWNSRDAQSDKESLRLFTAAGLRQLAQSTADLAGAIRESGSPNPPPSPPPPSPGAAGGP